VIYDFKGADIFKAAALDAVNTSQEKYCGVSSMLKKALPLTWEVNYNGQQLFNNQVSENNLQTIA
jgi:putative redox protein